MIRHSLAVAGLVVGGLALSPEVDAAAVPPWTVIELQGLIDGGPTVVADINDAGISVGSSGGRAVRWSTGGVPTELEGPEGCFASWAEAISNGGHIVGGAFCEVGEDLVSGAVQWTPEGTPTFVPERFAAEAVDDHGIVAGWLLRDEPVADPHAAVYLEGVPILPLPEAGGGNSIAIDLTGWGYVVGTLGGVPSIPQQLAVGWYGDEVFPLLLTGASSTGVAVNDSGVALVRTYDSEDLPLRGYLVAPGGAVTALDPSGQADHVRDVNDYGIVVGSKYLEGAGTIETTDDETEGRFYVGSQSVRLADTLSDEDAAAYDLSAPVAVNNSAWVVGTDYPDDQASAWLLKPPTQLPNTGASVTSR